MKIVHKVHKNVSFWEGMAQKFCSNSLKSTNMLNGKVGDGNVAATK